jgi:hypothetical protein
VILRAAVPQAVLALDPDATVLTLHVDHTLSPSESMPGSEDRRSLGLALDWLVVR